MTGRRLAGRVALVTGAAGGIGRAVAELFVRHGAGTLLTDLDGEACGALAKKLNSQQLPGRALGTWLDVTDPDAWAGAVRLVRRRFGYPDILVNNAGSIALGGLEDTTEQEWQRVVETCQRGTWLGMRATIPAMVHGGGGTVVNMASVFALVGSGGAIAYHGAKGAVRAMTATAAVEYASRGIRVNAVCPGLVATAMSAALPDPVTTQLLADTPLARPARPQEVAEAVLFLASGESSYVTGSTLVVDGGFSAR